MGASTLRKVLEILPPAERVKMLLLFAAMLVTSLLQTVGIASVMPFIALVANPELAQTNPWMRWLYETVGFTSPRQFLFVVGVGVIVLFAAVNTVAALTAWFSARFVWFNHHRITERLLERYLSRPYSFFLRRHGSSLNRTLLGEVKMVVNGVIIPGLDVVSRILMILFVVATLMWVDPRLAALASTGLGGAYAAVYLAVRRRQRHLGERRRATKVAQHRIASEALGGIKELKVLGRESDFVARFRGPSLEYSMVEASHTITRQLPGYALETLATGGMLAVVLYLLSARESLEQVLPVIALYAVAGNRLMPAFQQVFAGVTTMRFHAAALDELHSDLGRHPFRDTRPVGTVAAGPQATLGSGSEIEFRSVSFDYPGAHRPALTNIDVLIPCDATVGLVGSTGCGKTTFVDLLLGLFAPTAGEVLIDGRPLDDLTMLGWRSRLGYVPQAIFLRDATIAANIAFGLADSAIDHAAVERSARAAQLHDFVSNLPDGYGTMVGERGVRLSGGERQRIGIARALYNDPDVLVMDEATSALDTVTEETVMQASRSAGRSRTVIIIAHRLSTVRHCDVILLMESGEVTARGSYDELTATSATFRAMAGLT